MLPWEGGQEKMSRLYWCLETGSVRVAILALWLVCGNMDAAVIRVNTSSNLTATAALLKAGDTMLLEPGNYTIGSWSLQNLNGTRTNWISIRAVLMSTNWISLAGPVYGTNATVSVPTTMPGGFFRLRFD